MNAQILFEKGYFVDDNNQRIDCLIKNIDWKNNPIDFDYKLTSDGNVQKGTLQNVKEFGIEGEIKFVRAEVKIDRSSSVTANLTTTKEPIFKKELLFLKLMVSGKANLYEYEDGNLRRYFFSVDNNPIEQLVFKLFVSSDGMLGRNNQFKQQIFLAMRCSSIDKKIVEGLEYTKQSLNSFFVDYNTCNNVAVVNYNEKKKRDLINLSIRPRVTNASLEINNAFASAYDMNYGSKTNIDFGVELEFILPFNKNKWALAVEPTYRTFNAEARRPRPNNLSGEFVGKVDYNSIEVPISVRHYFFLNKNSKIFANFSYILDFSMKANFEILSATNQVASFGVIDLETGSNFGLGVGYKFRDKYSIEFRHHTKRQVMNNSSWDSSYNANSIIFGYTIF